MAVQMLVENIPQPNPGDIILLRYPHGEYDFDQLHDAHRILQEHFSEHYVLTIPKDFSLDYFSKENFEDFIDQLRRNFYGAGQQ